MSEPKGSIPRAVGDFGSALWVQRLLLVRCMVWKRCLTASGNNEQSVGHAAETTTTQGFRGKLRTSVKLLWLRPGDLTETVLNGWGAQ